MNQRAITSASVAQMRVLVAQPVRNAELTREIGVCGAGASGISGGVVAGHQHPQEPQKCKQTENEPCKSVICKIRSVIVNS